MITRRIQSFLFAGVLCCAVTVSAQDEIPANVSLITSEPENDYAPAVSPNGQWLVYVSERTGDPDLFALRLNTNRVELPISLAPSAAEDRSPQFSPDGKWLAWISTREDAFGDVWVMRFPDGNPMQITERGTSEFAPEWVRRKNGVYLRWQSEVSDGRIVAREAKAGDWKPQEASDSAAAQEDQRERIVALYVDDTNGDGQMSEASGDAASIWSFNPQTNRYRQITPPIEGLNNPQRFKESIIFSANFRDNLDVARIDEPYPVAKLTSPEQALESAREMRRDYPLLPFLAVSHARQGYLMSPGSAAGNQSLILMLDILREANRPEQALFSVGQAMRANEIAPEYEASMAWRRAVLQVEEAERGQQTPERLQRTRQDALAMLGELSSRGDLDPETRAHIGIESALIHSDLGDRERAIDELSRVQAMSDAPPRLLARAGLMKGRIYQALVPAQARRQFIEVLNNYPDVQDIREDAALELARSVVGSSMTSEERVLALRELSATAPEIAPLQAAARYLEGNAFADSGQTANARTAYLDGMEYRSEAPRLAAQSAFALAELQARQGQYEQAIDTYQSVAEEVRNQFFAGAPQFYEDAIEGLIRQYLAKGNYELRVGDAQLARVTFQQLLDRMPRLVEGWRGLIDALDRTDQLSDGLVNQWEKEAKKNPGDDLYWYRWGLARTYEVGPGKKRERISRDAVKAIERAIALNGSVPYYHQTLGFIHEHYARLDNDRSEAARSLGEYQRALALLDAGNRPIDFARLLINAGNAAMAVDNYQGAAQLYDRRLGQGVPFDDPRTEFLLHRNMGIALFRSYQPARAVESFAQAQETLLVLIDQKLIDVQTAAEVRTQLMDRQALAMMETGRHRDAAEMFTRVAERNPERSMNRARALRNRGFALHRLSRATSGPEQQTYRAEALAALERALTLVQSGDVRAIKSEDKAPGIFGMSLSIAASEFGSAAQNLSVEEEERLIQAAMARLRLEGGDTQQAIVALQAQLDSQPKLETGNKAYYLTARLLTLDQLAAELERAGERKRAKDALIEAIEVSRFETEGVEHINTNGLTRVLLHLTEVVLRDEESSGIAGDLKRTWLGQGVQGNHSWVVLDGVLENALARKLPDTEAPVLVRPVERARLLMARALLAERQSTVDMTRHANDPLVELKVVGASARAGALAERVINEATSEYSDAESKRLGVLAYGVIIRQQYRFGTSTLAARTRDRALLFANSVGYPDLRWWLDAQVAVAADAPRNVQGATAALEQLEGTAPGLFTHATPPYELIDYCQQLVVRDAVARGNFDAALSLSERWNAARLNLAMNGVRPVALETDTEDSDWLARALDLREAYRAAAERVRVLPFEEDPAPGLAQLRRARDAWAAHIDAGRTQNLPSALLLNPRASKVSNPSRALQDALALPKPIALVLAYGDQSVAWTSAGATPLATESDWRGLENEADLWFVMGDAMPDREVNARLVRLLTFETTFLAMSELHLDIGTEPEAFPGASDPLDALQEIASARNLRIEPDLRPINDNPYQWSVGSTNVPLGTLLAQTDEVSRVQTQIEPALPGVRPAHQRAREEILAAVFARDGVSEADINDRDWLGVLFTAKELPEVAEAELSAAVGLVRAYMERGETPRALAPARRIHALRRALELDADQVVESGQLLAQVQGDLRRYRAASDTMREVVELRRQHGTPEELAQVLKLYATYAGDAKQYDEAYEAFLESAEIISTLNQTEEHMKLLGQAGVVRENAGYYPQALELYHEALQQGEELGDYQFVAEQWRRVGRVYLLLQNEYLKARDAFTAAAQAAERAGDERLVQLSTLDLARVDERLGRYEQAMATALEVQNQAEAMNDQLLVIDSLLVQAFIEWATANYFDAFKYQRSALDMARQLNDEPFQIIALNTGGLIYWALNDTENALGTFNQALELARGGLFDAEVASTLNNRGLVYRSLEEYELSLEDLRQALAIDERERNRWGIAYAQRNIGITLLNSGQAAESIAPLEQAEQLAAEIGDRTNRAKALVALGDARRENKKPDAARSAYEMALEEAVAIPLPEVEWRALYGLALIARAQNDTASTRQYLGQAIEVVERIRARIKIEEFQDGFLLDKQELYDDMITLLLNEGEGQVAFEYSERSRSRNFIDLLGNQRIDFASVQDTRSLERERELRQRIEEFERQAAGAQDDRQRTAAEEQLALARNEYNEFLIELRAQNPQLSAFVEVETVDLPELQSMLEEDTRLVVYHSLPEEVAAWVIGPRSLNVVRSPFSRDELNERIRTYRSRLQNFDQIGEEADILSQVLWRPVEPLLGNAVRVGIAPHRELHLMPFASLQGSTGFVIDRYSLFHTPSASVLRYTFGRRGLRDGNLRVLAIGNPDYGGNLTSLPFAQKEAERIAWTFPEADILTGDRATEEWVTQNIGNYGIIHLATHGEYDPNLPLMSAIFLSPDGENDGRLTAREVFGLSMNADLVALSACQTGLGRLTNGDEVVGLNRSFVYSGTRQILSSLWRVDDVSTAVLVKHFYRNMDEQNRAEALRRAQLEVRSRYPHPAHWAGLFLLGDWQ